MKGRKYEVFFKFWKIFGYKKGLKFLTSALFKFVLRVFICP